jgi:hypothetical protein
VRDFLSGLGDRVSLHLARASNETSELSAATSKLPEHSMRPNSHVSPPPLEMQLIHHGNFLKSSIAISIFRNSEGPRIELKWDYSNICSQDFDRAKTPPCLDP